MATVKKKKKYVKWIILAIVLVLIVLIVSQCGKGKELASVVNVAEVKKGNVTATLDTSGTIASEDTKTYNSPVNAQVAEVNCKVGQKVKAGDYILTYDTASLENSYTQSQLEAKSKNATTADTIQKSNENAQEAANQDASIQSINSQIDGIKANLASIQNTLKVNQSNSTTVSAQLEDYQSKIEKATKDTSKEDMEAWKSASEQLSAQLQQLKAEQAGLESNMQEQSDSLASLQTNLATAEAKKEAASQAVMSDNAKASLNYSSEATSLSLTNAENDLSKAKAGIKAEFDGIVSSVSVTSGMAATEGQKMVTIANTSAMKVDFNASKYNLKNLKEGQKVKITSLDHTYDGSISLISKIAVMQQDENAMSAATSQSATPTSMVAAETHIDNPDENLIIGMDAKLKISLGSVKEVLVIPTTAVNTDKDSDFVYVVEDGVVKKKVVTTGLYGDDTVEIKDGLKKGEHVITVVDSSTKEGMTVVENLDED